MYKSQRKANVVLVQQQNELRQRQTWRHGSKEDMKSCRGLEQVQEENCGRNQPTQVHLIKMKCMHVILSLPSLP